ncbi:MAG: enoyl-CoA hydratase/isomerase family protein [Acidimicrobiia bacterium]
MPDFSVITYETSDDHVATITLNRPDRMNSFNQQMLMDMAAAWQQIRHDDDVHAVVLRAAGDRAFCSGLDVVDRLDDPITLWDDPDPSLYLGAKHQKCYKPVVAAVHGIVAGGAMYWLNEVDIIISSDDATFFDPHVTYGMTSVLEPIGMSQFVPFREALRWALMGLDERVSPQRMKEIGLISEVVSREALWPRAHEIAAILANKHPVAMQGTVKVMWDSIWDRFGDIDRWGIRYVRAGNAIGENEVDRGNTTRPKWRLRD